MRVLRFTDSDESKRAYNHFDAALRGADVKGIEQIRRVGKMLDKFEGIGEKKTTTMPEPGTGKPQEVYFWKLLEAGGEVWLDSQEHGELMHRMGNVEWRPEHARFVAASFDMLEKAPEEDPAKLKAEAQSAPAPTLTPAEPGQPLATA